MMTLARAESYITELEEPAGRLDDAVNVIKAFIEEAADTINISQAVDEEILEYALDNLEAKLKRPEESTIFASYIVNETELLIDLLTEAGFGVNVHKSNGFISKR